MSIKGVAATNEAKMKGSKSKMKFITYELNFTTWTTWTSGLLVKDAFTLVFNDDNKGELIYIEVMINYSARGYGRMTIQEHYYLDERMLDKHQKYMVGVNIYRNNVVMSVLDVLKYKEFKNVNDFIKEYNKRAYVYYG